EDQGQSWHWSKPGHFPCLRARQSRRSRPIPSSHAMKEGDPWSTTIGIAQPGWYRNFSDMEHSPLDRMRVQRNATGGSALDLRHGRRYAFCLRRTMFPRETAVPCATPAAKVRRGMACQRRIVGRILKPITRGGRMAEKQRDPVAHSRRNFLRKTAALTGGAL